MNIPVDYKGNPEIVDGMKYKFMGEFSIYIEGIGEFPIPWTDIKEIYKQMAIYASNNK